MTAAVASMPAFDPSYFAAALAYQRSPIHYNSSFATPPRSPQQHYQSPTPEYSPVSNYSPLTRSKEYSRRGLPKSPAFPPPRQFDPNLYVALDAEFVGVGRDGLQNALARVSICDYSNKVLLDTFCRPEQPVVDHRSWVSGVRASDLEHAPPFNMVREWVQRAIRGRILVGHAVFNDLAVLGLTHPKNMTRDTAIYEPLQLLAKTPHPSLRALAKLVLKVDFQSGEHSSIEDARVTMDIFKAHQNTWEDSLFLNKANYSPDRNNGRFTTPTGSPLKPSSPSFTPQQHQMPLFGNFSNPYPTSPHHSPQMMYDHHSMLDAQHFQPLPIEVNSSPRVNLPSLPARPVLISRPSPPPPATNVERSPEFTRSPPIKKISPKPASSPKMADLALDPRFSAANSILPPLHQKVQPEQTKTRQISSTNRNRNSSGSSGSAQSPPSRNSRAMTNAISAADSDLSWRETAKAKQARLSILSIAKQADQLQIAIDTLVDSVASPEAASPEASGESSEGDFIQHTNKRKSKRLNFVAPVS